MGVLVRELAALYRPSRRAALAAAGAAGPVRGLRGLAARAGCAGEVLDGQLAWWRERLAGAPALLALPTDRPRPAAAELPRRASSSAGLAASLASEASRALGRRGGRDAVHGAARRLRGAAAAATPARTTWWSARRSPAAPARELEGLIGFFVNTLVLRADLSGDPAFRELAGAGARDDARRLRPPGPAVREAGRGAAAGARPRRARRCSRCCFRSRTRRRSRWSCPAARARARAGRRRRPRSST